MFSEIIAFSGLGCTLWGAYRGAPFLKRTDSQIADSTISRLAASSQEEQAKIPRVATLIAENHSLKAGFRWIAIGTALQMLAIPASWMCG